MEKNEILFAKLADDVIIPSKRDEDAGFDIYAHFDEPYMVLAPHETRMVPTGLVCAFDQSYVMVLKERGSTGSKGIGLRCGVVDSGFRGQIFVCMTNHNEKSLVITKEMSPGAVEALSDDYVVYPYNKAICQAVLLPLPDVHAREVSVDEIMAIGSERGTGAVGSSGK
ncbi:MAG: dUTP diphosphatase [Agathobacter sp.]